MVIALLAGGTGGAKLACGLRDEAGELQVVTNTADDIEIYGVHVSPDPDLVTYRLAGVIGERGFGIAGEGNREMRLREARGEDTWFALGDEDFAVCHARAEALAEGRSLSTAHTLATVGYPTGTARVLPMSDEPVRTEVRTASGWTGLQQYLIAQQCEPAIEAVRFAGIDEAEPTDAVLAAIEAADAIVIGPSNPIISIAPILALPALRAAIERSDAPVLAVSPFVGGTVLKGPTAKFMAAAGFAPGVAGFAEYYADIADMLIADEPSDGHAIEIVDVAMPDVEAQRRLARQVLQLAERAKAG